jgi:nitroimidazol reductase NimA-like FMN-containing flavoprotein (pyridoxamine 5'-phosphate oxidase superfamily)
MLLALEKRPDVCLTVTQLDALVVARSGFHMSVNYRSAMLFGKPYQVAEPEEKLEKMEQFIERLYPGHWKNLRPVNQQELKAMSVFGLRIDEAVAKVRSGPPIDEPEDYRLPIWAGVVPVQQVLGAPADDGRVAPGAPGAPRVAL